MRKTIKNAVCLSLATIMGASLVACGGKVVGQIGDKDEDGKTLIGVTYYSAGYGEKYMEEIAKKFNERAVAGEYDFKVILQADSDISANLSTILEQQGGSTVVPDLIICQELNSTLMGKGGKIISLNDVYEMEVPTAKSSTGKMKIKDKIISEEALDLYDSNGTFYGLPMYGSTTGLVYNKALFEEYNLEIPVTMADFWDLMEKVYKLDRNRDESGSNDIASFVYPSMAIGYFTNYIADAYLLQMLGLSEYNKLKNLVDIESRILQMQGVYTAMYDNIQSFATCAEGRSCYVSEEQKNDKRGNKLRINYNIISCSQNTDVWPVMSQQKALMSVAGDWAENESGAAFKTGELGYFPVPLICDVKTGKVIAKATPKAEVEDEKYYIKVERAKVADSVIPASDVNEEYIYFRKGNSSNIGKVDAIIPKAGLNNNYAKQFLAYLCSDEALELYAMNTGSWLPYKYELPAEKLATLTPFKQQVVSYGMTAENTIRRSKTKAVMYGLRDHLYGTGINPIGDLFTYSTDSTSLYTMIKDALISGQATIADEIRRYEIANEIS